MIAMRKEARVIWNSCHSTYFRLKNGVKQGRVLSPTLFNLYIDCCSFYGTFLWKYNSDSFGKCCTQWNKCIRRIYYLPYNTHRWLLGPLIGQYHTRHQLILRDIKYLHSSLQSTNSIVRQCIMNASSNANTLI